jgi:hypothetical protein
MIGILINTCTIMKEMFFIIVYSWYYFDESVVVLSIYFHVLFL